MQFQKRDIRQARVWPRVLATTALQMHVVASVEPETSANRFNDVLHMKACDAENPPSSTKSLTVLHRGRNGENCSGMAYLDFRPILNSRLIPA